MINTDNGYVIAEAALQHGGRPAVAKKIARRAKQLGADAVKFQLFFPDEPLFCPLEGDEDRWPRWERSIMSKDDWRSVAAHCERVGIDFLASAFQRSAVEFLVSLNVKAYKVASRAAHTYPYDLAPGPFIVSCGMGVPDVIRGSIYLQCKVEYPHAPYEWTECVGLSDHSGSPWPAINALAREARAIEVHVLFYARHDDPDASSSITTSQLRMICDARDAFAEARKNGA